MKKRSVLGVMGFVGLLSSGLAQAETLRFDCTHLGFENEKRIGDLVAVVNVDDSGVDKPVAVTVDVESVALYKKTLMGSYDTVLKEKAQKFTGDYCLAPRQLPRADRHGRDMNLVPAAPTTQIKQIYLSTLPKVSYVTLKNGDVFSMDCALDPM